VLCVALALATLSAYAHDLPETPFTQDPIGPLVDVTNVWLEYQPADRFCVKPDVFQFTDVGPTVDGDDPACARSGFAVDETGLVVIEVQTPPLCNGCRRIFLDYTRIPPPSASQYRYARGHAYFHLGSFNPFYTVEPIAHSPNIKNFTNDKAFVPDGSLQEPYVWAFDTHARAYTANTVHTVHSDVQGPYYTGPWYVNTAGRRVTGSFLDIVVATDFGPLPPDHRVNEIGYAAGFHSGDPICPDEVLGDGAYADGDGFYGGCVDGFGAGRTVIDPFSRGATASLHEPPGPPAG
jgi:hypothetical protein